METNKRKHYTQMTSEEIAHVLNKVRFVDYKLRSHAVDRMNEKKVDVNAIKATIAYGKLIEAHNNNPKEVRVLLRGKVRGAWCNVVLSTTTKEVVTCYWNKFDDQHKTLDKTQYQWVVDLKTVI